MESVPYQAPSATFESEGIIYHLRVLDGKPAWFQQQDGGSQGASGPGGSQKAADRKLVDGSNLGRPPPKTDSMDEITMADVVPLDKRVDIRQEILTMDADVEATKLQEDHWVRVKVQRSLQEAEAQSFKLYHPQIDAAIKKKAALQEQQQARHSRGWGLLSLGIPPPFLSRSAVRIRTFFGTEPARPADIAHCKQLHSAGHCTWN